MPNIRRFEELIAWRKARGLTREIYQATRKKAFAKDFGLSGQIQRAAVSVMSNIAEGFERNRLGEFHQFLSAAKASCAEVRSQLFVAFDVGYLDRDEFDSLLAGAEEVARIIGGLRASIEKQRDERGFMTRDAESYSQHPPAVRRSRCRTQDSGLRTQDSALRTQA